MVNGLGVLGWGVGGIEAEAAMLGQPLNLLAPQVLGVQLVGALNTGVTATDVVLSITKVLRDEGVVGKFRRILWARPRMSQSCGSGDNCQHVA